MTDLYHYPQDAEPLNATNQFHFHCHAGLACFNRCCQRPTIILKPYDIMRLRRRLGITSTAFLARYTLSLVEEASRLPLRLLALRDPETGGCPFLDAATGCTVYADRPAACRLFPVIQGSSWTDAGVSDAYFLKKLPFCQGFGPGPAWTLAQWHSDQGLAPYDQQNQGWVKILLQQGTRPPAATDGHNARLFELAVYDLDAWRRFVLETAFAATFAIPPAAANRLRQDDETLLQLGYAYASLMLGLLDDSELTRLIQRLA